MECYFCDAPLIEGARYCAKCGWFAADTEHVKRYQPLPSDHPLKIAMDERLNRFNVAMSLAAEASAQPSEQSVDQRRFRSRHIDRWPKP